MNTGACGEAWGVGSGGGEFCPCIFASYLYSSPARERIHMKNQDLFSSKDKSKEIKCHLLQFLFGALRVNWRTDSSSCNLKGKLICQPRLGF